MEVTEGIIIGVAVGAVMLIINAVIRRIGVHTRTDRLEEKIDRLEKGYEVILRALLPLLLSVKGQKPNGELDNALKELNDFLIHKGG